jgi:hypothetical protein
MGFVLRAGQLLLGAAVVGAATPSCYSAGVGTAPPTSTFYFPVGLAVLGGPAPDSADGSVLYAVNSDFDLQYNGGTLQSYDLGQLRKDADLLIKANLSGPTTAAPPIQFLDPSQWNPSCAMSPPLVGVPLGEACAPPVNSTTYVRDTAIIGAFATELQISIAPAGAKGRRLFLPVRGDASLTWADIGGDPSHPFQIDCGHRGADNRCEATHHAGSDPNQPGNTRQATMPGEPFGMAQTEDGTAIAITHQSDTKTSLLTTGLSLDTGVPTSDPTMQFVLDGLPTGGVGIVAVPHDPDAPVKRCEDVNNALPCFRPAFLETSRTTAEIDLLRYYDDDGSSLHRPFLQREAAYPITSNAVGTDSRGIVIDKTPRIACKAHGGDPAACAQLPARVFFASHTPPALGIGEIGGSPPSGSGTYDPDRLVLTGNVPMPPGPSKVYLAPIVDAGGALALRVFIVCFDASQVVVYDPDAEAVESVINVGVGPFAMAFDPFSIENVGRHAIVPTDTDIVSADSLPNKLYRFAYVASFTQSYVQMIDLDNSQPTAETFERVVYTLGQPTKPKGR